MDLINNWRDQLTDDIQAVGPRLRYNFFSEEEEDMGYLEDNPQ